MAQRHAVLILGMHRSGTSALTRVLALRGAALPATLIPPDPGNNDTGFWEPETLVALHDAALAAMGSSWDDIRTLPPTWFTSDSATLFRRQLSDLIDAEYNNAATIVVKDPRLCRLLPLWLPVLAEKDIAPRVVIPLRHPLEVADSLRKRDNFDTPRATQLWLSHLLAAERDTRHLPRCVVTYDDLLADWRAITRRIATALTLDWTIDEPTAAPSIDQFLARSWRHHALPETALDTAPPWLGETYRWMQQAASGHTPPPSSLDDITTAIMAAEAILGPAIGALQNEIARKTAETKHWVDAAVERYAIIEAQRRDLDRLGRVIPITHLRRTKQTLDRLLNRLKTWRARPDAERVGL